MKKFEIEVPEWLRAVPFAHRGLFGQGRPENSMAAFESAAKAGYGIELDVQLLADGEAVVFHDDDLARLTGERGRLRDESVNGLRRFRLSDGSPIPLLGDVLRLVAGRAPLYIEIKNRLAPGPLERRVLDLMAGYGGRFAVASFNPWSMAWFARRAPDMPRGIIACAFRSADMPSYKKYLYRNLLLNALSRPHFVSYNLDALPCWAALKARRRGQALIAWTVRGPKDLEKARRLADNFVFEGVLP